MVDKKDIKQVIDNFFKELRNKPFRDNFKLN